MSELPWLKLYTEMLHDPKFVVAATDNQMDEMTVVGIWVSLLCLAARSPVRGSLIASNRRNFTIEQLDAVIGWHGNMGTGDLSSLMQSFIDLDMITVDEQGAYCISNFEARQETKDERANRMNRERQKRYQENHKNDEDRVINNVINNDELTQDSISISISNSLIKDSLTEKTLFSPHDAEKALLQVMQFSALPSTYLPHLENVRDLLKHYGWDETINRLTMAKNNWVSQKNKTTGANYKLTNPAWIDNAITGEYVGVRETSREERILKELEDQARRFNP